MIFFYSTKVRSKSNHYFLQNYMTLLMCQIIYFRVLSHLAYLLQLKLKLMKNIQSSKSSEQIAIQMPQSNNLHVLVRVRPLLSFQDEPAWRVDANRLSCLQSAAVRQKISESASSRTKQIEQRIDSYDFKFEGVADVTSTSERIYKTQVKQPFLEAVKFGRNVSIMAYGQTCSGKTHTILGVTDAPGIIPCVLRDLFMFASSKKCTFKLSYLEVYNEKIFDLLDREKSSLKLLDDPKWGCEVANLTKIQIRDFDSSLKCLLEGEKSRQYAPKENHERSSRSHTLLRIYVQQWDDNFAPTHSTVNIVDLAGSERVCAESQSNKETGYINKSLFLLSNVMSKLSAKDEHIPFRDSKLTRLLEASLVGDSLSFALFCISPAVKCFGESLNTLRLAKKSSKIELTSKPTKIDDTQSRINHLQAMLKEKQAQCALLEQKVAALTDKIAKMNTYSVSLVILFDHQNFYFCPDIPQSRQFKENSVQVKEKFVQEMQTIYEHYTEQLVKELLRGSPQEQMKAKIDEICFLNMAYSHEKINQYKLSAIAEIMKDSSSSGKGELLYCALQDYYNKLIKQCGNFGLSSECSIKFEEKIEKVDKSGRNLYLFGSKKDSRVCQGKSVRINEAQVTLIDNLGELVSVSCGYHHSIVISKEGKMYGWGKNHSHQINSSEKEFISVPMQIAFMVAVRRVAAGWGHTLALTRDGRVYGWGENKEGQLGLNHRSNLNKPEEVHHPETVMEIYCGHSHSGFLDSLEDLYMFGFNEDYRCMISESKQVLFPHRVPVREVMHASCGVSHSGLVTKNGRLICGGTGSYGELGVTLHQENSEKISRIDRQFISGEQFERITHMVPCQSTKQWKEVHCGENMTIGLTQQGDLFSFGRTTLGRLGHQKSVGSIQKIRTGVQRVEVGCRHGLLIQKGKVYGWGFNMYGQASFQSVGDVMKPEELVRGGIDISCGFFHSAVISDW